MSDPSPKAGAAEPTWAEHGCFRRVFCEAGAGTRAAGVA
jgi:hypothetical protein